MALSQSPFQASLLPASFRGVPFLVNDDRGQGGRRNQTHEYPFRDEPYTEDLGRRARRFGFSAFVLGDDCALQREALLAAFEQKGAGSLVHPSFYQPMQVIPDTIEWEMTKAEGRAISFRLAFVEAGKMIYPSSDADTQGETKTAADSASTATADSYAKTTTTLSSQSTENTPGP